MVVRDKLLSLICVMIGGLVGPHPDWLNNQISPFDPLLWERVFYSCHSCVVNFPVEIDRKML